MGFLDHSTNNIIVDAVLTDLGRQRLAQNDGSFSVVKFALGDDEIDYSLIKKFGLTVGREKIEKNTPIFEAQTSSNLGLKFKLLSMSSQVETQLPSLINATEGTISTNVTSPLIQISNNPSVSVRLVQKVGTGTTSNTAGTTVPIDIQESVFMVRASSRFLTVKDSSGNPLPVSYISQRDQMAMYRKAASVGTSGNPTLNLTLSPKSSLNETIYNTFGNSEGQITTVVVVTGLLTGIQHTINLSLQYS